VFIGRCGRVETEPILVWNAPTTRIAALYVFGIVRHTVSDMRNDHGLGLPDARSVFPGISGQRRRRIDGIAGHGRRAVADGFRGPGPLVVLETQRKCRGLCNYNYCRDVARSMGMAPGGRF
jgi:hypothetical protein